MGLALSSSARQVDTVGAFAPFDDDNAREKRPRKPKNEGEQAPAGRVLVSLSAHSQICEVRKKPQPSTAGARPDSPGHRILQSMRPCFSTVRHAPVITSRTAQIRTLYRFIPRLLLRTGLRSTPVAYCATSAFGLYPGSRAIRLFRRDGAVTGRRGHNSFCPVQLSWRVLPKKSFTPVSRNGLFLYLGEC